MTKPSIHQRIPKQDLAISQLNVAIQFYMQGEEYPAVITLAGAAEELFGKIAAKKGLEPVLKREAKELIGTVKEVWGHDTTESEIVTTINRARNEMKHICSGDDLFLNYESQAARLITRALENYFLCFGTVHPSQRKFYSKKLENWRAAQAVV